MIKAERNDAFRTGTATGNDADPVRNRFMISAGVNALGPVQVAVLVAMVRAFDQFDEANDPYGEHDFGTVEYDGHKYNWKIDDHGGFDNIDLVCTITGVEDY